MSLRDGPSCWSRSLPNFSINSHQILGFAEHVAFLLAGLLHSLGYTTLICLFIAALQVAQVKNINVGHQNLANIMVFSLFINVFRLVINVKSPIDICQLALL